MRKIKILKMYIENFNEEKIFVDVKIGNEYFFYLPLKNLKILKMILNEERKV